MKASEPCPWCNLPRRHGEGCHIVEVRKDDPSGRAPGKYTVCGSCAGFDYSPAVGPLDAEPKRDFDYCPICRRAYRRNKITSKLRLTEEEHDRFGMPLCLGWGPSGVLRIMCDTCYQKYAPTVRERVAKPFVSKDWPKAKRRLKSMTAKQAYAEYVCSIGGQALM